MDMITAMLLISCLCFVFFNFGQIYAILRGMREDDRRHAETMRRLREGR